MLSASYTDPRLAAVYDALNPLSGGAAFYCALAAGAPLDILEIGCGTGRLACLLAAQGHRVIGADPASAMLAIARARPGADRVTWLDAEAAGLALDHPVDLVVMTGHVFQVFLGDGDVRVALATARRHLAPGGRLAFETRNPAVREWALWTPGQTHERLSVPGLGTVDVHYAVTQEQRELVSFETRFRFAGADLVTTTNTLRFMPRETLAAYLADAGFAEVAWYGDWDGADWTPGSPEIIAVAR